MDSEKKKPLVVKKILSAGTKNITFKTGSKVYFHFQTKVCKGQTLIDDSRKIRNGKPMELIIGKKFKLEIWEQILQMMSLNEVAKFLVDKSLVAEYPFVAKTIRDAEKPECERSRHCCGMILQHDGVGYSDLNQLLKYPQHLEFILEIVRVESPDEYKMDSWQLGEDEKLKMVPNLKETGNIAFKNKDYKTAEDTYATAIGYLEQLSLKEKPHDEEWNKLQQLKVPLLLNFAQCKLLSGDFYAVIEHCNSVLEVEPDNVKGLFRRAKAHVGAWNPQKAKDDFLRVAELDSTLKPTVKKHLDELEEMIKIKTQEDKEKLRKLFVN